MINVVPFKKAFNAGSIHNQDGTLSALGKRDNTVTAKKIAIETIQIKRL